VVLEPSNWLFGKIPAVAQHAYDAEHLENHQGSTIIPNGHIHDREQHTDLIFEIKRGMASIETVGIIP
jgi:hypothetical protein